jgi:phosphohistidine phosphatase
MTRHIGLLRHAKSSWDSPNSDDFDRPLNKRGQRDAPLMGAFLREQGIRPELIISSDAARAQATALAVARELGYPATNIVFTSDLYLAEARTILEVVATKGSSARYVIAVAHNPGLTDFVNRYSTARLDNLPTCAYAEITTTTDSWEELQSWHGDLKNFFTPKRDLQQ